MEEETKVQVEQTGATEQEQKTEQPITAEQIQKMIQSETDKVRTEYSKKVKDLEAEKTALEKEKMTEEEKARFDLEKLQKDLLEKESAIQNRELTIKTIDLLKDKELPLEFREFVIGQTEESTITRVESFTKIWNEAIKKEIEKQFKEGGRTVNKTTGKAGLTKDDILAMTDPIERKKKIAENIDLFN